MLTILCAMQPEADAIIKALSLSPSAAPWAAHLSPNLWSNNDPVHPITLVTNGFDPRTNANLIGTTPATFTTQLLIHHLNPSLLLIAGASGGCSQSTSIGQVFLVDKAYHHDRRIPLEEFRDYAHGPEPLVVPCGVDLPVATLSTGNALDTLDHELAFFKQRNIILKDMETASIAWSASQLKTPVMAIRSVTDFYDHATPAQQFLENFDLALSNLADCVAENIGHLCRDQCS